MNLELALTRVPGGDEGWERIVSSDLGLSAELFPGDRDNSRVVMQVSGWSENTSNSERLTIIPSEMGINSSYLELTTSIWAGGPQWLVRLGDQSLSMSSLIERPRSRTGVSVSNVNIGSVNTRWAYLWGGAGGEAAAAVMAQARLRDLVLRGTFVDSGTRRQLALEGNSLLLDGLAEVQAGLSFADGNVHAASVSFGWEFTPGWSVEGEFAAIDLDDPEFRYSTTALSAFAYLGNMQFSASVEAIDGEFDSASVSAQRPFMLFRRMVRTSYTAMWSGDRLNHRVTAQTSVDLGVLRGVGLRASIGTEGARTVWRADASYSTPGGPSISIQYNQSQQTTFRTGVSLDF